MRFFSVVTVGYIVVGMEWGGEGYGSIGFLVETVVRNRFVKFGDYLWCGMILIYFYMVVMDFWRELRYESCFKCGA